MTKKIFLTLGSIILLVVIGLYIALQIHLSNLKNEFKSYLINEKGYQESDILRIDSELGTLPAYAILVWFRDDPDTRYVFTKGKVSGWNQISPKNPKR